MTKHDSPAPHPLSLVIRVLIGSAALGLSPWAIAQQAQTGEGDGSPPVPVILVTLGVDENTSLVTSPFNVVDAEEMIQGPGTLGDLLNGLPGIHADSFGGGASRPVIRGQTSPRVTTLSDGSGVLDASSISPDHATTVDPLLARRIEVLRGPATLLYGGGAIGGVVNVLDDKVPTAVPDDVATAHMGIRGDTVAHERAGAASLTASTSDNFVWHFEGSTREADAYEARGYEEDRVDGTFAESRNASLGGSWVGEKGYLGLAYSWRMDQYGIPGHTEEFADCHPHGDHLHCGGHEEEGHDEHDHEEHDHEHEHHASPYVDLKSTRIDLRGEYDDPLPGIHSIRLRSSYTDYRHFEIEEDEIITEYTNQGYEGRIEFDHAPLAGWHGVFGGQFSDTTFASLGEESFIPETDSHSLGVFAVEHYEINDQWHVELGARYETQELAPVNDERSRPEFDSSTFSYSGAVIWAFADDHTLAATYARAQRLPTAQELYARGVHLATNTYECGLIPDPLTCGGVENNAPIRRETSNNIDITLRKHSGALTYSLNVFHNDADDYIYARSLDQHEEFRLIKYTQADAKLKGFEAEVSYQFTDALSATLFGDQVRASLPEGGNLPRISPERIGARINAEFYPGLNANLEYYHVDDQDEIADYETVTPGYHMLNASIRYDVSNDGRYNIFLRGSNLLDKEVRNHTSFLADVIPMPGRNISGGFSINF